MSEGALYFSVLRYQPDMQRQEVVNAGVVLFTDENPRVALAPNLGKLLALDPNLHLTKVYEQVAKLQETLRVLWSERRSVDYVLRHFTDGARLSLSPVGMVDASNRDIDDIVDELQRDLVMAPARRRSYEPRRSSLHTELRSVFRQSRILGSRPTDISKHLVVPNFPIDPDLGLFAEFALRNGQLHVTETVDFRTSTPSHRRQEAQAKALLLVQAEQRVGKSDLRRYVVVTGVSSQVQSSVNLLSRFTEDLIVRESAEDWRRYVDAMHRAATPEAGSVD